MVILGLILLNGIFVAAEFSILASSKTHLSNLAGEGSKRAEAVLSVRRDHSRMHRYITTAQSSMTLASLALGMYGEPAVATWLGWLTGADPHGYGLSTASILLLTYPEVVLGEIIPKALAVRYAPRTAMGLSTLMRVVETLLFPLVASLSALGKGLLRLLRVPPADESRRLFSPDEIELVVRESREGGLVGSTEELMIENIFDLSERTADQVMTPRIRVEGIPADLPIDEVLERLCDTRYSRHPVYHGDLDHIAGLLYAKDLARHYVEKGSAGDLRELLRPARFVPESAPVESLLKIFRSERIQLVVVLDEYGGTAGIVTLEDVVEEVVGEIQDEFDQEIPPLRELGAGLYEVRADLLLDELGQRLRRKLEHPEVETVGGLVMDICQGVPTPGQSVEWEGLRFTVLAMERTAVQLARLEILPEIASDDSEERSPRVP